MKIAVPPGKSPATGNLTAVSAALLKPPLMLSALLVGCVFVSLCAALGWASQAEVLEVALGDGQVIHRQKPACEGRCDCAGGRSSLAD